MITISERAAAYLEHMPPAIAGSGGHAATFNATAALTRGFAMPEQDALPLLMAWNQSHCLPPWTESELRHKLRSAANSTRPNGYLLDEAGARRDDTAPDFESDAEKKARQRRAWPQFYPPTPASITAIAALRRIPPDGVYLAHCRQLLKRAMVEGHKCFVIHEGTFAQARRLDGEPFTRSDGSTIKAKNLTGSEGAFIGQGLLGNATHVLLVEGVFGLVEALTTFAMADSQGAWSILAATSAGSRFARDPALLARLAGRHVRIVPDADEAGRDAAASWLADLEAAGVRADAMPLPDGFKDLGDLIAAGESHLKTLNALFQ
jgi:Toprim-like